MNQPSTSPFGPAGPLRLQNRLEAAIILRGVVRLVLDDHQVEVQPRAWFRENGTQYLEARRRDSGERMVVPFERIRDVRPY